ncbi:vacuolar ATPase assembly protein VMA22 [Lampetra fluviatilis]
MKDMNKEVKEVREALDEVTLATFDDLENLNSTRARLHDLIQQGWLSLSKARYSMGSRAVSTLQYPHHITPQAHVHTSETEGDGFQFLTELTRAQTTAPSEHQQQQVEELGAAESPELRRRKAPPSNGVKEEPSFRDKCPSEDKQAGLESSDPLRWFGILVPQNLRQAQGSFREAVLLAGEVATLQARVEERRVRHRALLEKKTALLANDGETRGEERGELLAEQ